MAKSIRHTLFYPHPPHILWEYLTQAELIAQWLMPNDFQPIVGHTFQFRTPPMPNFSFDGIIYCQVLELVPLQKLTYSWKGGPAPGEITLDSLVEWTLTAKEQGTELLLEHSGFVNENLTMYTIMERGWLQNMQKVEKLIQPTMP